MKKLFLIPILFLTFSSFVSAEETTSVSLTNYYRDFDKVITDVNSTSSKYQDLLSLYYSTYEEDYPYFVISSDSDFRDTSTVNYKLLMFPSTFNTSSFDITNSYDGLYMAFNSSINTWNGVLSYRTYDNSLYTYVDGNSINYWSSTGAYFDPLVYSNFNWQLDINSSSILKYTVSPFTSSTHNLSFQYFEIEEGDYLPSYMSLYNGNYSPSISYTEVNLNNYSYVALSLRDYNREPFSTNFIVKGQLCLTPVYNYGMSDIANYNSPGYQTQECTIPYDNFTPMREYILQTDIDNKAIYYLKAYNTSIENIVKVDTNIFNITYITQQNENNPSVIIGGRSYPTIPYNDLTTTATKSTQEGYISGRVENVFDVSSDSSYITNLFSNPLQTLQSVWSSIIVMFSLIGSFISLLPPTLQAFLFSAFSIGIVLGIIKILT